MGMAPPHGMMPHGSIPPPIKPPQPEPQWRVAKTQDGREYYYDTKGNTRWDKPEEFMTDDEVGIRPANFASSFFKNIMIT